MDEGFGADRPTPAGRSAAERAPELPGRTGRGDPDDGPLIVQSDKTLLLEVDHPAAAECRQAITPFAELERTHWSRL